MYARRREGAGSSDFDLVYTQAPALTFALLCDDFDLMSDDHLNAMWFSAQQAGYQRVLKESRLFVTLDSWASVVDESPALLSVDVRALCEWVNPEDEDMLLFGATLLGNVPGQNPHAILAMLGDDSTTPVGRAGDSPAQAPFAGSIPYDCGGVCYDGVQVAGWLDGS